jgi:hypothetical protein
MRGKCADFLEFFVLGERIVYDRKNKKHRCKIEKLD